MVSNFVLGLFHLVAAGQFSFGLYYHFVVISPLESKVRGFSFGGSLVYLTILASVVNVIYYTIAFVNDFISSNSLKKARDLIFGSLALPLALETSLMYWVMTSIDRELVFPKALDDFFPLWHDILIHTNVSIFILIDLFLVEHTYPRRSSAIRVLITFLLCYLIWLYVVFINTGRWVYAVIGVLSAPQRIIFFVACGLVTVGIYFIGETMNTFLSGRNLVNEKKKKK